MSVVQISQEEKNDITRDTMDRLLYCEGYKEELKKLNSKFNPHKEVKYSYSAKEPLFPIHEVIS